MRLGSTRTPPLAMVLTAAAICTALTESDWPKAMRSSVWLVHSEPEGRMPGLSAQHADPGALPEAEAGEVVAQLAVGELVRGQHGADVGGLREHAGQRQPDRAVVEPVADRAVLAVQRSAAP